VTTKRQLTLLIFLFFLSFSTTLMAQFSVSGIIIDQSNTIVLTDVIITDTTTKVQVTTDFKGKFTIETQGTLVISREGYETQTVQVTEGKQLIISLLSTSNELDAVIINGITIQQKLQQVAESVDIVPESEINSENTVQLAPILNRVPGVYMQSGSLNTNRITIRGIGARSPFSTANIRA